jgi:hypothetical protein
MKIELKNVKHSEFASQETDCFQASVYIDGKKAGTVQNDGHGGCNYYEPWELADTLNEYANTLPPVRYEYNGEEKTIPEEADTVIGNLLNQHLRLKRQKSLCKGKTVYRIPGHDYKDDEWHIIKKPFDPTLRMYLVGRYGAGIRFLNDQVGA